MQGISLLAEELSASQEGICSVRLGDYPDISIWFSQYFRASYQFVSL